MNKKSVSFQNAAENASLLKKLSWIGGSGSVVLLGITLWGRTARGGDVLQLAVIPYALAALFAFVAVIFAMLRLNAAREEEEKQLLANRLESKALNVDEDVRFTAGRSFANFARFAPFVTAVLAALLLGFLLYRVHAAGAARVVGSTAVFVGSAVHTALICAVLMMVSLFTGVFLIGQSRTSGFRYLRPVGAWLVAGFIVLLAAAVASLFAANNMFRVDLVAGKVLFWIFAVLGAEFIVNFIIEFYRPRTIGEERPVFESQLLSLFTEPGGVMRNIASALDYQFGFNLSGTELYRFIEHAFFPILILWALLLWGFSAIHEVGANQVGIKEYFGRKVSGELPPGIYWTLPYPFGEMKTFSTKRLHRLVVGENAENAKKRAASEVVLWTNEHGGAVNPFLAAVSNPVGNGAGGNDVSSISLVNLAMPIEYRIKSDGIEDYAYKNASPVRILQVIGEQVAVEFFAGASMDDIMSKGRHRAEETLRLRIQKQADLNKLGLEIVRVGIMDAHPPVEKVAPAYQATIGALEEKETEILKAQAYSGAVLPEARAAAQEIVSRSLAGAAERRTVAAAESERFRSLLLAYRVMPEMFRTNLMMEVLEQDAAGARKFVVSPNLGQEVYQLNFEQKERLDLVDIDAEKLSDKKR